MSEVLVLLPLMATELLQRLHTATTAGRVAWAVESTTRFHTMIGAYELQLVILEGDFVVVRLSSSGILVDRHRFDVGSAGYDDCLSLVAIIDADPREVAAGKHRAAVANLLKP